MNLKDLEGFGSVIEKFAPTVASMLGGPMAGIATSLICHVFGIPASNAKVQTILSAISGDPNVEERLRELETQVSIAKLNVGASDTADARATEIEEEKLGIKDNMPKIITIFLMACFVTILVLLFTQTIDTKNSTLLGAMVGMLAKEFIQACRFYIGGDGDKS